jgi:hypothetical protein
MPREGDEPAETIKAGHVFELVRGNSALSHFVLRLRGSGLSWREVRDAIDAEINGRASCYSGFHWNLGEPIQVTLPIAPSAVAGEAFSARVNALLSAPPAILAHRGSLQLPCVRPRTGNR